MAITSTWLVGKPIDIAGQAHPCLKNPDRYLPKFIHDGPVMIEEHIHMYKDGIGRLDVVHEDVACRMFPNTLDNVAIMWYASLPEGLITSLTQLEQLFLNQFNVPIDPSTLYNQLATTK